MLPYLAPAMAAACMEDKLHDVAGGSTYHCPHSCTCNGLLKASVVRPVSDRADLGISLQTGTSHMAAACPSATAPQPADSSKPQPNKPWCLAIAHG